MKTRTMLTSKFRIALSSFGRSISILNSHTNIIFVLGIHTAKIRQIVLL